VIIPGGKIFDTLLNNISQSNNTEKQILDHLSRVIRECYGLKKPLLLTSNASLLACKVLGKKNLGPGISVTFGDENKENKQYIEYAISNENIHKIKKADEHSVDVDNNIVSVPGIIGKDFYSFYISLDKAVNSIYTKIKTIK
jgi:hypothetical protein